jgi:hypothetical protein
MVCTEIIACGKEHTQRHMQQGCKPDEERWRPDRIFIVFTSAELMETKLGRTLVRQ